MESPALDHYHLDFVMIFEGNANISVAIKSVLQQSFQQTSLRTSTILDQQSVDAMSQF